ncbi:MAG: hypothetical protein V8Q84_11975 [Bilophila sp.]
MERLGPLCRQWGAPFILLPIQGRKLPVKAADRIAIIESLLEKADALRIPRRLVLVDVLALAVALKPEAAREGLETIRWCVAQGLPATIGLVEHFLRPARPRAGEYDLPQHGDGRGAFLLHRQPVQRPPARGPRRRKRAARS